MDELLDCPFCQSKAVRSAFVRISDDAQWHHVECTNCFAYGPHRNDEADAIADWNKANTRSTTPVSSDGVVEAVARAILKEIISQDYMQDAVDGAALLSADLKIDYLDQGEVDFGKVARAALSALPDTGRVREED